ncbi:MAG: LpqB family beta-propeller domain-containing protein, partial [Blastocatellia bacterium]
REYRKDFFSLSWSPDGKIIAITALSLEGEAPHTALLGVVVESGEVKPLVQPKPSMRGIGDIAWLKDGSGLALTGPEKDSTNYQIWNLSYPGGELRRITNDLANYGELSLTADNSALLTRQNEVDCTLWVTQPGVGARARQLTFRGNHADGLLGVRWTPDGRIVYASRASGNRDLWMMNADGSQARQLTDDFAVDYDPAVSPDERYLFFTSRRSGSLNLWRADVDGSNPKQFTTGETGPRFDFSPDGRRVIFESQGAGLLRLHKVSLDGGSPAPLTDQLSEAPAVSPDGKLIACYTVDPRSNQRTLVIIPFEGGPPIRTLEAKTLDFSLVAPPRWSPDGRSLIYIDKRQGSANLWRLPLDGGPPQPVTNFNEAKSQLIWRFDLSRDGKQLALARGSGSADVVLISEVK